MLIRDFRVTEVQKSRGTAVEGEEGSIWSQFVWDAFELGAFRVTQKRKAPHDVVP